MRTGATVGDMAVSLKTPSTASCEERTGTILIGFGGEFSFLFCVCDLVSIDRSIGWSVRRSVDVFFLGWREAALSVLFFLEFC